MKSCLVVDDSRVIRMVAKKILQELNFRVLEAENGKKALEICEVELPDVVLLDWNMPVMNGFDFMLAMRKLPGGDKVIIVFCSSINTLDEIMEAMQAGANEYVMKPFDSEIIQAKFEHLGLIDPAV